MKKNKNEINYFSDHIECSGCNRKFCHTVREFDSADQRYCMSCYMHRNGLSATLEIIDALQQGSFEHNVMLWEMPIKEIPKEIYDKIPFIKRGIKQDD